MKQHITVDQLNELKSLESFRKQFWKIYEGDLLVYGLYEQDRLRGEPILFRKGMIPADEKSFGYKLLSIGQMIEFLDEKTDLNSDEYSYKHVVWSGIYEDELCDQLWKQIKEVLEK